MTYLYELRVDAASDLVVGESRLTLTEMGGVLAQGTPTNWVNRGWTTTTAQWGYAEAKPFVIYGTFDIIADGKTTEPGIIRYCIDGECGDVVGPVPKGYTISGTTFIDWDKDALWDFPDEEGLGDVGPIYLLDGNGDVVAQTTSSHGIVASGDGYNYIFRNLPPGSYTVVAPTTAGELSNLQITGAASKSVVVEDANVGRIDFGYIDPALTQPVEVEVRAYVFFDVNRNGIMDPGERPLDGIGVSLTGTSIIGVTILTNNGTGLANFGVQGNGDYHMAVTDGGSYGLLDYWVTTTPSYYEFTIDEDTESPVIKYFGYYPTFNVPLTGDNHTIGFWMHNVNSALANRTRGIQVTRTALLGYLDSVESFTPYDDPYQFGIGEDNRLQKALFYLTPSLSGNSPMAKLKRQLLAAELNWAAGFTSSMPDYESAIYWYAEWVCNNDPDLAGPLAEYIDWLNNLGNM